MPDLPTITLSQEHFDRVVAAFPGKTSAAKVAAYKDWLVNRLIDRVKEVESIRIRAEMDAATQSALQAVADSLPPLRPEPPLIDTPSEGTPPLPERP